MRQDEPGRGVPIGPLDWRKNLLIVAGAGFCVFGAQHVLNNFTAGSYDTSVRASGIGMMLGIGRIGAILGPFVAGLLQQAIGGRRRCSGPSAAAPSWPPWRSARCG